MAAEMDQLRRDHLLHMRGDLRPPGALGLHYDYTLAGAKLPDPQLAQVSALTLGSIVLARRFVTDHDNWSALYFVAVARTGAGKERIRSATESVLLAAGLDSRMGPRSYTSAAAIHKALLEQPCHVSFADEFGDQLQVASGHGQGYKQQALATLREIWGQAGVFGGGRMAHQQYATTTMTAAAREELSKPVIRPSVTLVGMTTPKQFYDAISDAEVANGFVNRMLFVQSREPLRKMNRNASATIPPELIRWIKKCAPLALDAADTNTESDRPPKPVTIPFGAAGYAVIDRFEDEVLAICTRLDTEDSALSAIWTRAVEYAMRISLIIAASMDLKVIDTVAATWAVNFVRRCTEDLQQAASRHIAGSRTGRTLNELLGVIRENPGVSRSQLQRRAPLRNFVPRDRTALLRSLIDAEQIKATVSDSRGQETMRFFEVTT